MSTKKCFMGNIANVLVGTKPNSDIKPIENKFTLPMAKKKKRKQPSLMDLGNLANDENAKIKHGFVMKFQIILKEIQFYFYPSMFHSFLLFYMPNLDISCVIF